MLPFVHYGACLVTCTILLLVKKTDSSDVLICLPLEILFFTSTVGNVGIILIEPKHFSTAFQKIQGGKCLCFLLAAVTCLLEVVAMFLVTMPVICF